MPPTAAHHPAPQHAALTRPLIALTMGDPLGIGPEIIVKALSDPARRDRARFHVYGMAAPLEVAARQAGLTPFWNVARTADLAAQVDGAAAAAHDVVVIDDSGEPHQGLSTAWSGAARGPTAAGGRASVAFIERAIESTRLPAVHPARAEAIVTAPISKTSWDLAGFTAFPGHTELLAARFGAARHAMLFVGKRLRVILVTIHIPLARVPAAVTTQGVLDAIELGDQACRRLGIAQPRVAVCGLNPHAGEGGILGSEDEREIRPAITLAQAKGISAAGPFPGDAVFVSAANGAFDLVVAMYHDQGLIPIKLLEREETVNVTVGLPHPHPPHSHAGAGGSDWLIRTSPAHGTAFDIAGSGKANPASMAAAIDVAVRLTA